MKEVRIVPYTLSVVSEAATKQLFDIMVKAYALTEVEIWGPNYIRMPFEEFETLIEQEGIFAAMVDGQFVGSVNVYPLNDSTYSFGLLSVDSAHEGKGIGRKLIAAAEAQALKNGAEWMEIEVLRLRDKVLPFKEVLGQWYRKMGYDWTATLDFLDKKPDKVEKAKNFLQPSVFDCYRKLLVNN